MEIDEGDVPNVVATIVAAMDEARSRQGHLVEMMQKQSRNPIYDVV